MADSLELALQSVARWERTRPTATWLTQPIGEGRVEELTWQQALDEVKRMAAHLRSLELPTGSHIAVLSKNCAHWLLADLAIWAAGHVSIPLYPTLTAETISQILDHSEARLVFIGKLDGWEDMKPGVPDDLPRIALPLSPDEPMPKWRDLIKQHEPIDAWPERGADDLATIVYTSGSTGQPKGVMHTFGSMARAIEATGNVLSFGPEDRMISYLPLAHVFERWIVQCGSLRYGFQVFFAETLDSFVEDLKRAQPTLFVSVPRLWLKFQAGIFAKMPAKKLDLLLKLPVVSGIIRKKVLTGLGLQHTRYAGSGSAPLPPDVIAWYRQLGLELIEGYGMSENFGCSHLSRPGRVRVGYVGHPLPGVECRISDEQEIQVKSPGNMLGYYKARDLTAEALTEDGWLKTGDRGDIDNDGRLRITGRVKELFKTSGGKYVAPAPIENLLFSHGPVEQVCVAGAGRPQAHAVVMLSEEARKRAAAGAREELTRELEDALQKVNAALDKHEQLKLIAVAGEEWTIENGLLTPTLKMRRSAIEELYAPRWDEWYGASQPVVWEEAALQERVESAA